MNANSYYSPATLAAMAADLSQYLAEQFDGDELSAQEWDELHAHMKTIVDALHGNVGEDLLSMLMEAGADPDTIFFHEVSA